MVKVKDIKILQRQEKVEEDGTMVVKNIVFKREWYDDGTWADYGIKDMGAEEQPEQVIVEEPKKTKEEFEDEFDDGLDEDDDDDFEDEDDDEEPEEKPKKKTKRKKKFL